MQSNPANASTQLNIYHNDNKDKKLQILPVEQQDLYDTTDSTAQKTVTADIFELKLTDIGGNVVTSGLRIPDLYTTIDDRTVKLGTELKDIRSDITNQATTNNTNITAHIKRLEAIITNLTGQTFTTLDVTNPLP